jgi:hypothetical protein
MVLRDVKLDWTGITDKHWVVAEVKSTKNGPNDVKYTSHDSLELLNCPPCLAVSRHAKLQSRPSIERALVTVPLRAGNKAIRRIIQHPCLDD